MLVSLIVPCFNESQVLPFFYEELCKVTREMRSYEFEFLFIDDGSSDNTFEVIYNYAQKCLMRQPPTGTLFSKIIKILYLFLQSSLCQTDG